MVRSFRKPRSALSRAALVLVIATIGACVTPRAPEKPVPSEPAPSTDKAEQALRDGEFVLAAREFERLAQTRDGAARHGYVLSATDALIKAGQILDARQKLATVPIAGLDSTLATRRRITEARLFMGQGEHEKAARSLSETLLQGSLSPELAAELHSARAQAELALNNPFGAIRNYIAREQYLTGADAVAATQTQLWKILETQKRSRLGSELNMARDNTLAGWIELAIAVADNTHNPAGLNAALANWRKLYPKHPASDSLIASLSGKTPRLTSRFEQVALLLPLSSPYATAATAVRDGFFAAQQHNTDPDKPRVTVYDIGADPQQAPVVFEQAIREGAQMVIGPLGRDAADAIAKKGLLSIPSLLLSHTDETIPGAGSHVFQFGLPPEQEARQAAERAYLDGHRRAVVLHPKDAWGDRMQSAFVAHWQRLGGTILATEAYENPKGDYSESIKKLLNIVQSEQRRDDLQARVRQKLQFEPRPRQDIDFIFLAADVKHGRLIKPQLNFYHASRIPVYATSHVFSGKPDPQQDVDLDGVIFTDMPWMLIHDGQLQRLRENLQREWPHAQSDLDRLYALGIDSYALLPHLSRVSADRATRFTGVTSALSVDPQGRLHRHMVWAQFKKGQPRLLDGQTSPRLPLTIEPASGG